MARALACLCFALTIPLAAGQEMPVPQLPFYDWKACPFEGCTYSQWTANVRVAVFDTWKENRRPLAQLSKGDSVLSLTGVVITLRPGTIRLDRDLAETNLKRGDMISTYAYRGEGFSAVWFKGRYYSDFDISFTTWPDGTGCGGTHCAATYVDVGNKEWWVEVKLASGLTGWVNMEQTRFSGVYMLGAKRY